jgi:hypothetical protein
MHPTREDAMESHEDRSPQDTDSAGMKVRGEGSSAPFKRGKRNRNKLGRTSRRTKGKSTLEKDRPARHAPVEATCCHFVIDNARPTVAEAAYATSSNVKLKESAQGVFFLHAQAYGIPLPFCLDSGCSHSLMNRKCFEGIPGHRRPTVKSYDGRINCADNKFLTTYGKVTLQFNIGQGVFTHEFVIADLPEGLNLLGSDFLRDKDHHCLTDWFDGIITIAGRDYDLEWRPTRRVATVQLTTTTSIPGNGEHLLSARYDKKRWNDCSHLGIFEPLNSFGLQTGCLAAAMVVTTNPDDNEMVVRVVNTQDEPILVERGLLVGVINPIHTHQVTEDPVIMLGEMQAKMEAPKEVDPEMVRPEGISPNTPWNIPADEPLDPPIKERLLAPFLTPIMEGLDPELTQEERDKVAGFLKKHSDCFVGPDGQLGRTNLIRHHIDTGDSPPIKIPPRRQGPVKEELAKEEVKKQYEAKVLHSSSSPWSSPILLVKKKDGSTRFCVDYRQVNACTIKDAYPLPRIDDSLESLAGAKWFSTLDLASGYWQVEMDDESRPKTAIATKQGLFEYSVMPFGLCNAPATFQRLMELVLRGLQWEICLIYIDDVIVFGADVDSTLHNLKRVFTRLRSANLKLKVSKCKLFCRSVDFLGHVVGREGIHTDPTKVQRVKEWPTPVSLNDVNSFIGLAAYYQRFIPHFSTKAEPLVNLRRKDVNWHWNTDCERAFQQLKDALCEAPILAYPMRHDLFILDTDASNDGIGAVLSQKQNGVERVICYGSHTLNSSQRHYCTTKLELLAVITFIKQYRHYLYGRHFLLRTDHASLTWLVNFKEPEGMIARWITQLSTFDYTMQHRPGKKHGNADGLSRRHTLRTCKRLDCPDCSQATSAKAVVDIAGFTREEVKCGSDKCPEDICASCGTNNTTKELWNTTESCHAHVARTSEYAPDEPDSRKRTKRCIDMRLVNDWKAATKGEPPINILEDSFTSLTPEENYFTGVTYFTTGQLEASPSDGMVTIPSLTVKPELASDLEAVWEKTPPYTEAHPGSRPPFREHAMVTEVEEKETQADNTSPSSTDNVPDAFGNWVGGINMEQIATWQLEDPDIGWVLKRRLKSARKPGTRETAPLSRTARAYLVQWPDLMVSNNILYRRFHSKESPECWQLVVPQQLRRIIFEYVHCHKTSGHLGLAKTWARLQARCYWFKHRDDIRAWVQECIPCQEFNSATNRRKSPISQLPSGAPMQRIAIDFMGPYKKTAKGNTVILVIVDYFTKWGEAFALPDMTAETTAKCLSSEFVTRMGCPMSLHSDQGSNFKSILFKQVMDILEIRKTQTTPYRPQSDGQCENLNRTLKSILTKLISVQPRDWDEHLPFATMAYRSSVHTSTGFTPNKLMLGREVYTPLDLCVGPPPGEKEGFTCTTQFAEWLRDTMRKSHELARQHMSVASRHQKHQYNEGKAHMPLAVGTWVWKKINVPHALKPKWDGPWLIVDHKSDVIYRIEKADGESKHSHLDNLKPFTGKTPPSWVEVCKSREVGCQTEWDSPEVEKAEKNKKAERTEVWREKVSEVAKGQLEQEGMPPRLPPRNDCPTTRLPQSRRSTSDKPRVQASTIIKDPPRQQRLQSGKEADKSVRSAREMRCARRSQNGIKAKSRSGREIRIPKLFADSYLHVWDVPRWSIQDYVYIDRRGR